MVDLVKHPPSRNIKASVTIQITLSIVLEKKKKKVFQICSMSGNSIIHRGLCFQSLQNTSFNVSCASLSEAEFADLWGWPKKGIKAGEMSCSAQNPAWDTSTQSRTDLVLQQRRISQAFIHLSSLHFKQIYYKNRVTQTGKAANLRWISLVWVYSLAHYSPNPVSAALPPRDKLNCEGKFKVLQRNVISTNRSVVPGNRLFLFASAEVQYWT